MIEQAECLIFDLDGTLYEDVDHFQYYANGLKNYVKEKNLECFEKDYHSILGGEHPLSIGKVYDIAKDSILTVNPFTNEIIKVVTWDGDPWRPADINSSYPDVLNYDFDRMIAIGDGWWLPYAVARHYGVTAEEAFQCYVKTKDYMVTDEFVMTKTKGLKQALKKWREDKLLVLLTNSEDYDVENILKRIDLEGLFHDIIHSAKKPKRTEDHFRRLLEKYRLKAEQVVSIGDNFLNEIAPALKIGMKAIFVQPTKVDMDVPRLKVVRSLEDICL